MARTATGLDAEAAVVGLGAWGACALWQLARQGVDVIGIDRYGIGNVHGSSYGESRMFRTACLEHPGLVPLAQRSRELWAELEEQTGRVLMERTGAMLIGPPDGRIVGGALRAAREHRLDIELLDPASMRERVPAHAGLPDDHVGVLEPAGGLTYPEHTIAAAVDAARAAGARVVTDTRVTAVEPGNDGIVVRTALRTLRVARLVVAAGPWLSQLVPGLPLDVLRMPTTWFTPAEPDPRFTLERLPVFMRELADGNVIWGHGTLPGGTEVKLGLEDGGRHFRVVDPENMDRSVSPPTGRCSPASSRRPCPASATPPRGRRPTCTRAPPTASSSSARCGTTRGSSSRAGATATVSSTRPGSARPSPTWSAAGPRPSRSVSLTRTPCADAPAPVPRPHPDA